MSLATTIALGAVPRADGSVEARVWAPHAESVAVRIGGRDEPLSAESGGMWAAGIEARPGDDYRYVLDERDVWPDPASRWQPEGVRGPSRVLDTSAFEIAPGPGVTLDELVLYELHVGTFSAAGTFDGVIPRLAGLRELGVTAIELMPVATFPGARGWGYDGLYSFAPHPAYGGPAGLARLVDAAHREGLAVFLDVVYNHLGPGNEALTAFVKQYFELPPLDAADARADSTGTGGARVSMREHIHALWPRLTRPPDTPDSRSSLVPLPHAYLVPGGRFREVYYWDSYFTMLGLVESGRTDLVKGMLDNFAHLVTVAGHVPNGNRTYYLSRSQPPFLAAMVGLYAAAVETV